MFSVCVCVLEILVLKFFRLRDYFERFFCADWIIGWVICWIAFISVFFSSWKTGSTPPWYLAICWASQTFFLTQSRHLLNTWWIDRESSCLLDSSLTPGGSIDLLFLKLILCCSILAWYLSCWWPLSRHLPRQLPRHLLIP